MPNHISHIDLALEIAAKFRHPLIEANLGSYILGSCAPDIRMITHGKREDYHFVPISNEIIGAGTTNLFNMYPSLVEYTMTSERIKAFIAGYISHLIADEAWIVLVYRPYFDNRKIFEDPVKANVIDRALQLDMDRTAMHRRNDMANISDQLVDAHIGVNVEFLEPGALAEFANRLSKVTRGEFSWERLPFLASRRQDHENLEKAQTIARQFIEGLPDSLEMVYQSVPREALTTYRSNVVEEWEKAVRGFLT